jgi:hypothetical protein
VSGHTFVLVVSILPLYDFSIVFWNCYDSVVFYTDISCLGGVFAKNTPPLDNVNFASLALQVAPVSY